MSAKVWTLGGELIRRRYDDGALMWPRISESQQDSLDATCRKLRRFWHVSPTAARPD